MLKRITVFCGSASTCPEIYLQTAEEVGRVIARQGRVLIYGSGSRGTMGRVAAGAQQEHGYVIGVNLRRFENKHPYNKLEVDDYRVAETIQERKVIMITEGDACIALPGGVGTLDELTEIFSLAQLGIYRKPFGILNVDHYFDGFLMQAERARQDSFLKEKDYRRMQVSEDIETLLRMLDDFREEDEVK